MNIGRQLDASKGLDYGSGMAHSFFYGYINILLPWDGGERKGLKESIIDFESREGVNFPFKKLFLLIPLSGFCPAQVDEQSTILEYSKVYLLF